FSSYVPPLALHSFPTRRSSDLSVLLISLLVYTTFIKIPYQERILVAHNEYLANNYSEVIHTLQHENMEKLPYQAKYILADSYIKDRKSTRLNSSHVKISYAVFC